MAKRTLASSSPFFFMGASTWSSYRLRTARAAAAGLLLIQIGAIALNGILDAQINLGETVAVFGMGVVGQLVAQLDRNDVARLGSSSIDLLIDSFVEDRPCFKARHTVCVFSSESYKAVPIPDELRPRMEAYLAAAP